MTLRFTLPNSGITIEGEDEADLHVAFEGLGGSSQALSKHIKRAVTAFEHGPAAANAVDKLNAEIISDEPNDPDAENQEVDDPWAAHPSERQTQNAPARRTPAQSKASQPAAQPPGGDPAQYLGEDKFANKYYRDANAPECSCGVQAIRKAAISSGGKRYQAHVCFDAGPKDAGADYRNKCDFHEFINTKKGR